MVGDTNEELREIWNAAESTAVLLRGNDFEISENELAVGGRMIDVRTERAVYKELPLPLHGQHQGDNASIALAAVEEFFGKVVDVEVIREGFAAVKMPGRFEVLGRGPLVVIDGAHNPAGADVCAQVFFHDFSPTGKPILVV